MSSWMQQPLLQKVEIRTACRSFMYSAVQFSACENQ